MVRRTPCNSAVSGSARYDSSTESRRLHAATETSRRYPTADMKDESLEMLIRALAVWLMLAVVAITFGTLRQEFLEPKVGESAAHVIGTAVVVAAFILVVGLLVRWTVPGLETPRLWILGAFWTLLTVAFEFGFGHYVVGHPWSRLFHDYNLLAGRVWVIVLFTLLVAPVILGRLRVQG